MAICATCGQDNPDGDWSCRSCGAALGPSTVAPPPPGGYEEPVHDRAYYEAPTTYGTAAPTIRPLESRSAWGRKSKLVAVIVGIVVVAAILGVAWFFFLRPPGGQQFVGTWKGIVPLQNGGQSGQQTGLRVEGRGRLRGCRFLRYREGRTNMGTIAARKRAGVSTTAARRRCTGLPLT